MDRKEKPSEEPFVILLVEDNPAHAEMVKRALEGHPVANRIIHLTDGEAALDFHFRRGVFADPEKSPRPHVVLLDLRLPRIDGLEVLREIRTSAVLEKLPVVILTTSEAEIDADRAYEHHANSFLV
jgi:CheY-like chemotaxis protein